MMNFPFYRVLHLLFFPIARFFYEVMAERGDPSERDEIMLLRWGHCHPLEEAKRLQWALIGFEVLVTYVPIMERLYS